ncbi:Isochorismatase hydrolase [Teratosphaeria nubilosa]|uniref:Isochorismatase hydrolase n=1 Tax=Teratosphaeria nubilosa TaxID=161662 RepID=A0A6G1L0T6_9PEZI|nr:Isochorismatase hydrolase [Teratosphaeria nubilosa]
MHLAPSALALLSAASAAFALNASTTPGYDSYPDYISSTSSNSSLSFGRHYAVLNLDLIAALVGSIANTTQGEQFISNTAHWINTVHAQDPPPLSIFTRIYFSNSRKPEIGPNTPFAKAGGSLGNASDPETQIYSAFEVDEGAGDVVLQKTRYYAGTGNGLEEILSTQGIDTVVLSGIRTSGVILSTAYRLFDLNYNVYVIANNTIESPSNVPGINDAILEGIIPKLPANVITIEQAIAALQRSGPAIY